MTVAMFPVTATYRNNGGYQMTVECEQQQRLSRLDEVHFLPYQSRVEIMCSEEIKKLWCDLRDSGKFSTDLHFLSHLLNLEKLWQTGSLDVVTKTEVEKPCVDNGLPHSFPPPLPPLPSHSQQHLNLYYVGGPSGCRTAGSVNSGLTIQYDQSTNKEVIDCPSSHDRPRVTALGINTVYESSSGDGLEDLDNEKPPFQSENDVEDLSERPLDLKSTPEKCSTNGDVRVKKEDSGLPDVNVSEGTFAKYNTEKVGALCTSGTRDHKVESSESGNESFIEEIDMYAAESDLDKHYSSPVEAVAEVNNRVPTMEESEEIELRKRPLRKRLKKIVQGDFLNDVKSLPEANSETVLNEATKNDTSSSPQDDVRVEESEPQQTQESVKNWCTRRLPQAASPYMKVMRIGNRISPDRKGTPTSNTLTLKGARTAGKNKLNPLTEDDAKNDQLAELMYCQGSREIKCPLCAVTSSSKKEFMIHLRHHVKGGASSCTICKVKMETKEDLLLHLQTHAEKSYKCDKCSVRFNNRHRLNVHFFEHLTEEAKDDFRCDVCGKPCYSKCYLQRHRRRHTGEKPYMCDVCGKVYYEMSTLNTHRRSHTDERFTCDVCGNRYMQKSALNLHMKSAHEGIKEHMCERCGKAFFDKHHLQKHIRIHTGEKPYQCDFCGKSFTQKVNRDQHRRLHTGEQPYRCEYCLRSFALRAAYTQHLRKHTGVKVSELKRVQLEKLQQEWSNRKSSNVKTIINSDQVA